MPGFVAEAIDEYFTSHRGLLRGADIARWAATYEPPVTLDNAD